MLVDAGNRTLMLTNGQTIPFADAKKLFTLSQLFSDRACHPENRFFRTSMEIGFIWIPTEQNGLLFILKACKQ